MYIVFVVLVSISWSSFVLWLSYCLFFTRTDQVYAVLLLLSNLGNNEDIVTIFSKEITKTMLLSDF